MWLCLCCSFFLPPGSQLLACAIAFVITRMVGSFLSLHLGSPETQAPPWGKTTEGAEGLESHRQLYLVCYKVCRLCHCEWGVMWMRAPQWLLICSPRPHCCHRPVTCGLGCWSGQFVQIMCIAFLAVSEFFVSGLCCFHQRTPIAAPFPLLPQFLFH